MSIIQSISKRGGKVKFIGLDQYDRPVIQFTDRRRTTSPFAIPYQTHVTGAVVPIGNIRWFTDEELDKMPSRSVDCIYGCHEVGS